MCQTCACLGVNCWWISFVSDVGLHTTLKNVRMCSVLRWPLSQGTHCGHHNITYLQSRDWEHCLTSALLHLPSYTDMAPPRLTIGIANTLGFRTGAQALAEDLSRPQLWTTEQLFQGKSTLPAQSRHVLEHQVCLEPCRVWCQSCPHSPHWVDTSPWSLYFFAFFSTFRNPSAFLTFPFSGLEVGEKISSYTVMSS